MAFNQNIAQEYNRNKILTASPAELTLMLYEGAIKFCNIAIVAIEKKDYEKANINIKKAENIITEFKVTLNHKYAVAEDFEKIYDYIYSLHNSSIYYFPYTSTSCKVTRSVVFS